MTSVKRRTLTIPMEHTNTAYMYKSEKQAQNYTQLGTSVQEKGAYLYKTQNG